MQHSASVQTFDSASSCDDVPRPYSSKPRGLKKQVLSAAALSNASSGSTTPSRGIDSGKYRTKMCRHYLMGLPCPFEERCVFAHGEEEINTAAPAVSNAAMRRASSALEAALPPPPSYDIFINEAVASMPFSAFSNSPVEMAPAAPLRYRFEPYAEEGIVYE